MAMVAMAMVAMVSDTGDGCDGDGCNGARRCGRTAREAPGMQWAPPRGGRNTWIVRRGLAPRNSKSGHQLIQNNWGGTLGMFSLSSG